MDKTNNMKSKLCSIQERNVQGQQSSKSEVPGTEWTGLSAQGRKGDRLVELQDWGVRFCPGGRRGEEMTSQKWVVTEPGRRPGPGVLGGAQWGSWSGLIDWLPPTPARETAWAAPQSAELEASGAAPSPRRTHGSVAAARFFPRPSCRPRRAADRPNQLSEDWGRGTREGVARGGFPVPRAGAWRVQGQT